MFFGFIIFHPDIFSFTISESIEPDKGSVIGERFVGSVLTKP